MISLLTCHLFCLFTSSILSSVVFNVKSPIASNTTCAAHRARLLLQVIIRITSSDIAVSSKQDQFILRTSTLPLSSGAGGGAGIGEEDPREAAPMLFVLRSR